MKRILFLLLLTVSVYGQNPSRFAKIQITGNANSVTATKVNVQEADGVVNTIAKNDLIDVVEVNDVPSLPLVGEAGKIYVVKNLNKIYRWNGTFYQELAGSDPTYQSIIDALGYTPENVANKAIDFSVVDNVKYPTVQAVSNQLLESNKKWVLFGDSLSNTLLDPDYPFYVIQNLKLTGTVTNAVAGNTSADQLTILNSILTSTPTYFNSFDIASLLVGVNDWATNVPLGNRQSLITDANFAGRLKAIIEKIITAKPSIRLYVMTPFETNSMAAPYNSFNTAGYTLREMSVLISQICSDYSVQCIDLYSLAQLNLQTIPTLLSDGVHPNSVGAKVIGDIVAKAFLSNNNKGKLVDTGIKRKREDLYEEVDNNIYKIQKGSFQPSTIYDVDYKVGLGKFIPSIKLEVVSTTIDPAPLLGSGTKGVVSFLSNNSLYGEYIGSSNNGDTWHQIQRNDGSTATYNMVMQPLGGNFIVGSLLDNGEKLQVTGNISATSYSGGATLTGTPTAPTAAAGTNTTQIATTAFVQAAARPYKVYTALLSQIGNAAPTATVLENTLGGAVTWTRNSAGIFYGTLSAGVFTGNKTVKFATLGFTGISVNSTIEVESVNTSIITVITRVNGIQTDGVMSNGGTSIEIRIYN